MEVNEVITNLNPLEYDIYFYLIPGIDKKEVLSTIKLFHSELELSLKEKIIFEIVVFLNLHYHNKKGYYFVTQQLRSFLK